MKNYKKINWKGVSVEELHPTAHWPPTFLFCALLTRFLLSLRSQPPFHSPFRHSIKAQPTHSQPSSTLAFCLPLISFVLFQCPPVPRYIFCRCVDFFRFHLPGIIFIFFCFSWKPLAMNVWRQEKINEKENEPSGSNAKKNWRNFNPTVLVFPVFSSFLFAITNFTPVGEREIYIIPRHKILGDLSRVCGEFLFRRYSWFWYEIEILVDMRYSRSVTSSH